MLLHQKLQRSAAPTKPSEGEGLEQGKEQKELGKNKLASRENKKNQIQDKDTL